MIIRRKKRLFAIGAAAAVLIAAGGIWGYHYLQEYEATAYDITDYSWAAVVDTQNEFFLAKDSEEQYALLDSQGNPTVTFSENYDVFLFPISADHIAAIHKDDWTTLVNIETGEKQALPAVHRHFGFNESGFGTATIYPHHVADDIADAVITDEGELVYAIARGEILWVTTTGDVYIKKEDSDSIYKIDADGKESEVVIPGGYDFVPFLSAEVAAYNYEKQSNGKRGMLTENGGEKIPFVYDYLYGSADAITVGKDEKFGLIDVNGKELLPIRYQMLSEFNENGLGVYQEDDHYGVMNSSGKTLYQMEGEDILLADITSQNSVLMMTEAFEPLRILQIEQRSKRLFGKKNRVEKGPIVIEETREILQKELDIPADLTPIIKKIEEKQSLTDDELTSFLTFCIQEPDQPLLTLYLADVYAQAGLTYEALGLVESNLDITNLTDEQKYRSYLSATVYAAQTMDYSAAYVYSKQALALSPEDEDVAGLLNYLEEEGFGEYEDDTFTQHLP